MTSRRPCQVCHRRRLPGELVTVNVDGQARHVCAPTLSRDCLPSAGHRRREQSAHTVRRASREAQR